MKTLLLFWQAALVLPVLAQGDMRPGFHFTAEKNWLNDPNGLVWHDGEYHLFYQYNPSGDTWGHMSWGHAVSRDLLDWEHLPVAIPEKDGIMAFSGSAVVDHANTSGFGSKENPAMVAIYTGHREGRQDQRLAYSTDKGRTWTMYEGNPVLDVQKADFRDPKVFWHAPTRRWVMAVALSVERKIAFYGSADLKKWELLSEFGPTGAVKGIWECPDLFEVPVEGSDAKRWVLNINLGDHSVAGGSGAQYFTGTFDGKTFEADALPVRDKDGEAYLRGKVIADFERGFEGWEMEGEAFGEGPSAGTVTGQHPVLNFQGKGLVNGYGKGDGPKGRMVSREFKVTKPWLNFLVGGGESSRKLVVQLVVDGQPVRSATGRRTEEMHWVAWPVGEFAGKNAKVQLVDEESGEWGHLLFDHLVLSDHPARVAVEHANWVDYGRDLYAEVTWSNIPDAEPIWIGWMSNWKYAGLTPTSPWRSAMSIPRRLTLRKEGSRYALVQRPLERHWPRVGTSFENRTVEEANASLKDAGRKRFFAKVVLDPGDAAEAGIKVRVGPGEETRMGWSRASGEVYVDRTRSGNTGFHPEFPGRHGAPLGLRGGKVELVVVVDDCSVEVFADGGAVSITDLIFPSGSSQGIEFFEVGGKAKVLKCSIHPFGK
jgi:sucrose-6-phosphate hydrolase SacC (GH32 family)